MNDDAPTEVEPSSALAVRRPWFQFHLSTALVLMFVAAALLWLNIGLHEHRLYGWPFHVFSYDFTHFDSDVGRYSLQATQDNLFWLGMDIGIAVFLLIAAGVACEHRLRFPRGEIALLTRLVEILCLTACIAWSVAYPLHYYLPESVAALMVSRILSWIAMTFAGAFLSEFIVRLQPATLKIIGVSLIIAYFFCAILMPLTSRGSRRGGRNLALQRRAVLQGIEAALWRYEEDHGYYPPETIQPGESGRVLYEYLCRPRVPAQQAYLTPPPECVHVWPDGTKELCGPTGRSYIYRLKQNPQTGAVEPLIEETKTFRVQRR